MVLFLTQGSKLFEVSIHQIGRRYRETSTYTWNGKLVLCVYRGNCDYQSSRSSGCDCGWEHCPALSGIARPNSWPQVHLVFQRAAHSLWKPRSLFWKSWWGKYNSGSEGRSILWLEGRKWWKHELSARGWTRTSPLDHNHNVSFRSHAHIHTQSSDLSCLNDVWRSLQKHYKTDEAQISCLDVLNSSEM